MGSGRCFQAAGFRTAVGLKDTVDGVIPEYGHDRQLKASEWYSCERTQRDGLCCGGPGR